MPASSLFTPTQAGTVKITTATSTAATALPTGRQMRVKNADTAIIIFINFGDSTVTATSTTGIPIGPGDVAGFTIPEAWTHIATISASGTPILYVTGGNGS